MSDSPRQTWQHQLPAIEYISSQPNALLDACMGAGKSFIIVQSLLQISSRRTIILCPTAVLGVWRGQFLSHAPDRFNVVILDGTGGSVKKAEKIAEGLIRSKCGGLPLVVVVNYETFWRPPVMKVLSGEIWDRIVCDESHKIKAPGAVCSKEAWMLGKRCGSRTGMTGTPMPNGPLDIFGQYRFLQEDIFGRYKTHFLKRYAVFNKYIPQKVDEWINQEEMHEKINLIRYYISKDVLVLPEKQDIIIEVPLSPSGMKAYNEMKRESILELREMIHNVDGEHGERVRIVSAQNGAVRFLRCLQLAQGYSKDEDGDEVDTDTQKRRMLLELLENAGEPVCVYGYFKHDLKVVRDCCDLLQLRYGEISGARKDLTSHSKMPEDIDVMAVQCKSGSSGIDLTRARIAIVMNSGLLSPGDFDQMIARQYRPGQTKDVIYYHLITPKTVDETIAKARQEKKDVVEAILNSEEFF